MPIFGLLSKSEIKMFENNAPDSVRARALLEKTSYTPGSTLEFATIAKKLLHEAMTSKNIQYKQSIEVLGAKMKKCYDTKGVYKKLAPDFLLLSKNISSLLEDPDDNLPPVAEYSSGEEDESDSEPPPQSPDMTMFGEALLAEPKRSFAPTLPSSSRAPPRPADPPNPRAEASGRRDRTQSPRAEASGRRDRTQSPRASPSERRERSRSPIEPRGEKSEKKAKRSPSPSSAVERSRSTKKSASPASVVECITSLVRDEEKPRIEHRSRSSTSSESSHRIRSTNKSEDRGADEERLFSSSQSSNKRVSPWTQLNFTLQKKSEVNKYSKFL